MDLWIQILEQIQYLNSASSTCIRQLYPAPESILWIQVLDADTGQKSAAE
jgi:hypothetical protein